MRWPKYGEEQKRQYVDLYLGFDSYFFYSFIAFFMHSFKLHKNYEDTLGCFKISSHHEEL
jgi:hypothetical protein